LWFIRCNVDTRYLRHRHCGHSTGHFSSVLVLWIGRHWPLSCHIYVIQRWRHPAAEFHDLGMCVQRAGLSIFILFIFYFPRLSIIHSRRIIVHCGPPYVPSFPKYLHLVLRQPQLQPVPLPLPPSLRTYSRTFHQCICIVGFSSSTDLCSVLAQNGNSMVAAPRG